MLTIHFIFFSHCTSAFVLFPFFFVLFFTVFQCARVRVHVDGPHFKLNRGQGPTERERREKWVGVVVKVDGFRREKQDGWAEGRKERVKDREGIFSPPSFPPFSSPHVKDKPGGLRSGPTIVYGALRCLTQEPH